MIDHDILDDSEERRPYYNEACPACGSFNDYRVVVADNAVCALCGDCSSRFVVDLVRMASQDISVADVPPATEDDLIRFPPSGMSWPPRSIEAAVIARYEADFQEAPW